jgi:hypothetical protein
MARQAITYNNTGDYNENRMWAKVRHELNYKPP